MGKTSHGCIVGKLEKILASTVLDKKFLVPGSPWISFSPLKMLVLYETALGYCLFKVSDAAKLESVDLWQEFRSPEKANKLCVRYLHISLEVLILDVFSLWMFLD